MKTMMRCLFLFLLLLSPAAGQEQPVPQNGTAYLRCFGDLGERLGRTTWSLTYTKPYAKPGDLPATFFSKANGGYSSAVGFGASPFPSGLYTFTISKDGGGAQESLTETLEPGAMYSLLATIDGDRPKLRLVHEFPLRDNEKPGLVIHSLKTERLLLSVGENPPVSVPYSRDTSFFLPSNQITSPLTAEFLSARKTPRRRTIDYISGKRQIAVFFRNSFGQTTLSLFPAEPDKPAEELIE